MNTPEVMRVYIGSFWNKPYQNENFKELFQAEQGDLIRDLRDLPRNAAIRKVSPAAVLHVVFQRYNSCALRYLLRTKDQ